MKRLLVATLAVFFMTLAPALAETGKIGFVDLQKALNQSEAGKSAKVEISQKIKEYEGEAVRQQDELKKLKEELEKQAVLLSDEARAEKERDYQKKLKDFQRFTKDIQDEVQQRDADFTRAIMEEIEGVIKKIGESGGYSVILEQSQLLYADDAFDLTDKVIKTLDESSKAKN